MRNLNRILRVALIVCGTAGIAFAQEPGAKDCGTDAQCFVGAGQTCAPAKLVREEQSPARDALRVTTKSYTIRGRSDGECIVSVTVTNADQHYRQGQTSQAFHRQDMLLAPEDFAWEFIEKPAEAEIRALLKDKRKIEAIKRYREVHGVGLAEAKRAVDRMEAGGR